MITVNSIIGQIHDTGFGGYPYKVVVSVSLPVSEFNKLCPVVSPARSTICGRKPAGRALGSLVVEVNNLVYGMNSNIPAHNPSIDSQGSRRASDGIKTMEFVYFFRDHEQAIRLGFEVMRLKSGEFYPKYSQCVEIKAGA